MPIKFLGKLRKTEVMEDEGIDYLEVDSFKDDAQGPLLIRVETLDNFTDIEKVQAQLRQGNIVWVKIKPLRDKDMMELKRAVDRLRKTSIALEGDIAGVDEDYLVLTPKGVSVHRG